MFPMILSILLGWKQVFAQQCTAQRAFRQATSQLCVIGRHTIARTYLVRLDCENLSSEYKLHSRSPWQAQGLFDPILQQALKLCLGNLLPLGSDDTRVRRTGKKIAQAGWGRDPLSPPFHLNLQFSLRFLHTSVLVPVHATDKVSARALPIWFEEIAPVAKPGKRATEADKLAYCQTIKINNLSQRTVHMMQQLRQRVDQAGGVDKTLVFAFDGSFCNKTIFGAKLERTTLIDRTRKDAKLCFRATEGRRFYGEEKFTLEEVLKDGKREWHKAKVFHGGKVRDVEYKEVKDVLWQGGAKSKL